MRHNNYTFGRDPMVYSCAEGPLFSVGFLTLFCIVLLRLFTFAIIIVKWSILGGIRELFFHQFTLTLHSYHWKTIAGADFLLLRELGECLGIQKVWSRSVDQSLCLPRGTRGTQTISQTASFTFFPTSKAFPNFVALMIVLFALVDHRWLHRTYRRRND